MEIDWAFMESLHYGKHPPSWAGGDQQAAGLAIGFNQADTVGACLAKSGDIAGNHTGKMRLTNEKLWIFRLRYAGQWHQRM